MLCFFNWTLPAMVTPCWAFKYLPSGFSWYAKVNVPCYKNVTKQEPEMMWRNDMPLSRVFPLSFSHSLKLGGLLAFSLFVPALDFTIKRQKKIKPDKVGFPDGHFLVVCLLSFLSGSMSPLCYKHHMNPLKLNDCLNDHGETNLAESREWFFVVCLLSFFSHSLNV